MCWLELRSVGACELIWVVLKCLVRKPKLGHSPAPFWTNLCIHWMALLPSWRLWTPTWNVVSAILFVIFELFCLVCLGVGHHSRAWLWTKRSMCVQAGNLSIRIWFGYACGAFWDLKTCRCVWCIPSCTHDAVNIGLSAQFYVVLRFPEKKWIKLLIFECSSPAFYKVLRGP